MNDLLGDPLLCPLITMPCCFSVAEPETAEQNVSTGCHLMRFGSSAGENSPFPRVCWTGVTYALVHVVSDGRGGGGGGGGALRK